MLVIRLSRTGRSNQAAYRVVVAEHTAPVQGKCVEILGFYNPADNKKFEVKEDRIQYWMSVGAKPSDTVASLLKANGMSGMDDFISPRDKNRKKKNGEEEEEAPAETDKSEPAEVTTEAPAETEAPADAPAEEPKEEKKEEKKPEEKPAEEEKAAE